METLWTRLCEKKGCEESIFETLATLDYQKGQLSQNVCYSERYPQYRPVYRGFIKTAIADMLCQTELICERLGLSFDELRLMGRARFLRSDELERREAAEDV